MAGTCENDGLDENEFFSFFENPFHHCQNLPKLEKAKINFEDSANSGKKAAGSKK